MRLVGCWCGSCVTPSTALSQPNYWLPVISFYDYNCFWLLNGHILAIPSLMPQWPSLVLLSYSILWFYLGDTIVIVIPFSYGYISANLGDTVVIPTADVLSYSLLLPGIVSYIPDYIPSVYGCFWKLGHPQMIQYESCIVLTPPFLEFPIFRNTPWWRICCWTWWRGSCSNPSWSLGTGGGTEAATPTAALLGGRPWQRAQARVGGEVRLVKVG